MAQGVLIVGNETGGMPGVLRDPQRIVEARRGFASYHFAVEGIRFFVVVAEKAG